MKKIILAALLLAALHAQAQSTDIPHLEKRDNRYALMVDGKPFFMLGAQINNSSSWPSSLPAAWPSLEALHVNTVEAPVYWEQIEPTQNKFDFSNVDLIINQAREHHLRVVLLWFGTWKNGQNHYVPEWIKSDPKTYPREENADGKLLDVMSPNSTANLEADKHAFAALMQHLKTIDATQHTVLMIQVENESGSVGSIRDFSPAAQKLFDADVPADLTRTLHLHPGTWSHTFGPNADESFAAYSTAHYINEVATAGKAEYPLPMYCNVWFAYPVHALENRDRPTAGQEYPSGGPQQANIPIWKAAAPTIDILAPDFYSDDFALFREIVATYRRADNPLFIPETGLTANFGRYLFYALGQGAIGFSPFGIDRARAPLPAATPTAAPPSPAENYELLHPITQQIAELNLAGKLQTAVEDKGSPRQTLHFADPGGIAADAIVSFGFPQPDGAYPPGTPDFHGRALVAQLGPLDFLVTGFDASVTFRLADTTHNQQLEILHAEEGRYVDGVWQTIRILNGDQTDRGLNFHTAIQPLVRIHLHTIPLYDEAIHHATN
jgi:hypothetical protein